MKKIGLIVEYNPLHNGHVYHFNTVKKESNADIVIAVMSGNISMRGEISVFNKFDKSKLALEMGVDLIIELPTVFTIQNADNFAYYSVLFLNNIMVDEIWIGSENNDSFAYKKYYDVMNLKSYHKDVKIELDKGLSYKQATNQALINHSLEPLLSNDVLGLSYYKAISILNPNIELKTIKRVGNNYLDNNLSEVFSSAKSIRLNHSSIKEYVPTYVYDLYSQKGFLEQENIFNYLKIIILNNPNLKDIFLCEEGFENKLYKISNYTNYEEFYTSLITKRYTNSRINRIIWNTLFNITKDDMSKIKEIQLNFVRILGYNNIGKDYLNTIKKDVLIYSNLKNNINKIFDIELKISKILDVIYNTTNCLYEQKGPLKK